MSSPSTFPHAVDTFPTALASYQLPHPEDVNGAFDALNKIEDYLLNADVLNIRRFGGNYSGSVDNTQAFRDAYSALLALNGGTIYFGPGDWLFDSAAFAAALALAPDNAKTRGWTRILLDPRARVILSAHTPRFIDFGKLADHDLFRRLIVQGGVVDANNVGGRHHVVIGTYRAGSFDMRLNFDALAVRQLEVVNVPMDPTLTNHRLNISLGITHAASGEATQDTATDILVEDVTLRGGNEGVDVTGHLSTPGTAMNAFIDNVVLRRVWHSLGSVPNAQFNSANYQLGSYAKLGRFLIENCYGEYSGDVGIEVDSFDQGLIRGTTIKDANNHCFYWTNLNTPPKGIDGQILRIRDCHARIEAVTNASSNADGYSPDYPNSWFGLGTTLIEGSSFTSNRLPKNGQGGALHNALAVPMKKLVLRDFGSDISGWTFASATSLFAYHLYVNFNASAPTVFRVDGLRLRWNGTLTAGSAGSLNVRDVQLAVGDINLDVHGVETDCQVTTNAVSFSHYGLDETGPVTLRGTIEGWTPLAENGDPNARGILVRGTGMLSLPSLLSISGDFSRLPAGGIEVLFVTAGQNDDKVLLDRVVRKNGGVLPDWVNRVPGASPWVYQNRSGYRQTLVVSGGSVTMIRRGRGGSYKWIGAAVSGDFLLQPGDQVEISWSAAAPSVSTLDHF